MLYSQEMKKMPQPDKFANNVFLLATACVLAMQCNFLLSP